MMRLIVLILLLSVVVGCSSTTSMGRRSDLLESRPPPVDYKPPKPEEWFLPNGLKVMYLKDDEIPMVYGMLYIPGGTLWDPKTKPGLTAATVSQMRQGGVVGYSSDKLDLELEKLAAGVSTSVNDEYLTVSFSGLTSDTEKIFDIFSKVALHPVFDPQRLLLWKGVTTEGIRRRSENPSTVAGVSINQLVYENSRYGKVIVEEDVKRISQSDLISMHKALISPEGATLLISGNIDESEVKALVEEKFGDWKVSNKKLESLALITEEPKPGIYFIKMPFPQANIIMGHLGVPRLTPDAVAIDVFNDIFGTSLGSRLFRRIRTELGLVYGIQGGVSPRLLRGSNLIALSTKSESTGNAVGESIKVLMELQTRPVLESELAEAKNGIMNSFVFSFDSPYDILKRRASLKYLGYPQDWDDTYLGRVSAVSSNEIQQVASSRWNLNKFIIVVVGDENAYNSLMNVINSPGSPLSAMPVHTAKFDQKLVWDNKR